MKRSFREVGLATFLTSLTTALGFLTPLTSSIGPVHDFGVYAAVGVGVAYVLAFTLLPSVWCSPLLLWCPNMAQVSLEWRVAPCTSLDAPQQGGTGHRLGGHCWRDDVPWEQPARGQQTHRRLREDDPFGKQFAFLSESLQAFGPSNSLSRCRIGGGPASSGFGCVGIASEIGLRRRGHCGTGSIRSHGASRMDGRP